MKLFKASNGVWYAQLQTSGRRLSLRTRCSEEAKRLAKEARLEELDFADRANALTADALQGILAGRRVTGRQALELWKDWADRTLSPGTVDQYHYAIASWLTLAGMWDRNVASTHENSLDGFINYNEGKRSTRLGRLYALRSFFGFLSAKALVVGDPSKLLRVNMGLLSFEQKEPATRHPFTDDEAARVLSDADPETRMAVTLGLEYGLRLSDVVSFSWEQVSKDTLIVWTDKHDKRIELPRNALFNEALGQLFHRAIGPLLPGFSEDGRHYAGIKLANHFRRHGVNKTFHCLRHTFATRLSRFGESVDAIRAKLGHTHTETTQKYIHA